MGQADQESAARALRSANTLWSWRLQPASDTIRDANSRSRQSPVSVESHPLTEEPAAGQTHAQFLPLSECGTLSAQVTAIQKLLAAHGQDPEALSALFGKNAAKRTQQISVILETLKAIGQL